MLNWSENLIIGPKVKSEAGQIRSKLDKKKTVLNRFVITLASNGSDELDIVNTTFLGQELVSDNLPVIIAMAYDRKEALEIVSRLADQCYRDTGDAYLKNYLKEV